MKACTKLSKRVKSSSSDKKQKSCRLTAAVTMRREIVNMIKDPNLRAGPNTYDQNNKIRFKSGGRSPNESWLLLE